MSVIHRLTSFIKLLIFCKFLHENECLHLKDFGVMPLKKNDITLVFYATVENSEDVFFTIGLKMEHCCQYLQKDEMDCQSMILHSDLDWKLYGKDVLNLTMYYTNLYLSGRHGTCSILLRWRPLSNMTSRSRKSHTHGRQFDVPFNTVLPERNFLLQYWQNDPDNYSICSSRDEDPRNRCKPVNCLIKYSGFRSFYNQSTKLCQKIVSCEDNNVFSRNEYKKFSKIVLSPISNKCLNLSSRMNLTENLQSTTTLMETSASSYTKYPIKSVCVNSQISSFKQCKCNKGWISKEYPSETFNLDFDIYSMCDVQSLTDEQKNKTHNASTSLSILLILCVLALVSLCICIPISLDRYKRNNYNNGSTTFDELGNPVLNVKSCTSANSIISEVKLRREIVLPPAPQYPTQMIYGSDENQINFKEKKTSLNSLENPVKQTSQEQLRETSTSSPSEHNLQTILSSCNKGESNSRKSPKQLFIPQFSKSAILPLPAPLTPTIAETGPRKYVPAVIYSDNSNTGSTTREISDTLKPKTSSLIKLKSLLEEVKFSTNQLEENITKVNYGESNLSLNKFSNFGLHTTSSSQLSSLTEFWENVSDSDENDRSSESMNGPNKETCFWVNKFHLHNHQQLKKYNPNPKSFNSMDTRNKNVENIYNASNNSDNLAERERNPMERENNPMERESLLPCSGTIQAQAMTATNKHSESTVFFEHSTMESRLDGW